MIKYYNVKPVKNNQVPCTLNFQTTVNYFALLF